MKKHVRRKLSQERVDRINRFRDFREGEPSLEIERFRIALDESGRSIELHEAEIKRNAG